MKYSFLCLFTFLFFSSFNLANGARTEIKWLSDSKGRKIRKEEEKLYDNRGNLIKWVQYYEHGQSCETFKFDYASERKVKMTRAYCSGKIKVQTVYKYDKAGRLMQELDYDPNQRLEGKRVNTYKGNSKVIICTETYNANEKGPYSRIDFEYYPNGLLKSEYQTAAGSWFGTTEYKYNADKKISYMGEQVDGGVGLVETYYTYQNNMLSKDYVKIPGTGKEYHVYETLNN
ncbi:MAG TPA: hypothetical protein VL442_22740 [Mucilaginibacter sp.]|jgi:hypothetical protein|nr:hypothetical protein [Mucilaginibacter sp.]